MSQDDGMDRTEATIREDRRMRAAEARVIEAAVACEDRLRGLPALRLVLESVQYLLALRREAGKEER